MASRPSHSHPQGSRTRGATNRNMLWSQIGKVARYERRTVRRANRMTNRQLLSVISIDREVADEALFAVDMWPWD